MLDWQEVNDLGLDILSWWEIMVKPGIKKLAVKRSKELNREKRGELNLLLLRQAYLIRQLQKGQLQFLWELRAVQADITSWQEDESQKVILQSRSDEVSTSEKIRIYHRELHKNSLKRSSIQLHTEVGLLECHAECAKYLEDQVADLLLQPATIDQGAQQLILEEFTERDNETFSKILDEKEIKQGLDTSNLLATPGYRLHTISSLPGMLAHSEE